MVEEVNTEEIDPAAEGQEEENVEEDLEQLVPVKVLKAVRAELATYKDKTKELENKVELYENNANNQQVNQQQQTQNQPGLFDDMEDDDMVTLGQFKQILLMQERKYENALRDIQLAQQNPNPDAVIMEYLPAAMKKNPGLDVAIKESSNPRKLAFHYANYEKQLSELGSGDQNNQENTLLQLDEILKKASNPGSPSAAGGSGGGASAKDHFWAMSDDDFEKEVEDLLKKF